jgi:ribonuclease HI
VLLNGGKVERQKAARVESTTNNKMELTAAIQALDACDDGTQPLIYSDSQYVVRGIMQWSRAWKRYGWRYKPGKDLVKNLDLWKELDAQADRTLAKFEWVRGHDGNHWNEYVDQLCSSLCHG